MLLGPSMAAVSGVSTHLNQLFGSVLAQQYELVHFQVGSEGRGESRLGKLLRLLISPWQFLWALLRVRPDLVHLNTSLEPKSFWRDAVYLALAKLLRTKVLYQVHGGALPHKFFEGQPLRTAVLRRVLLGADVVVLLAQEELRAYRAFEPRLRLTVIPNAIEIMADPRDKRADPGPPLTVAYVGRLAAEKGIFDLLAGVAAARAQGCRLRLLLAGSGPDEAALRQRVAELGIGDAVQFVGAVFGEGKDALWRSADVFGFPTLHREGLPYALLEAMAARTPPLICAVGAIPDVMQDGVHGYFVPPRDPAALAARLVELDANRALLDRMREAGRRRVEEGYSLGRLAGDFRNAYVSLGFNAITN